METGISSIHTVSFYNQVSYQRKQSLIEKFRRSNEYDGCSVTHFHEMGGRHDQDVQELKPGRANKQRKQKVSILVHTISSHFMQETREETNNTPTEGFCTRRYCERPYLLSYPLLAYRCHILLTRLKIYTLLKYIPDFHSIT